MTPEELRKALQEGLRRTPDAVGGALELPLHLATGAVAQPLAGLSALISKALGDTNEGAGQMADEMSRGLTYEPRTETGRQALALLGQGGAQVKGFTDKAAEKLQDYYAHPTGPHLPLPKGMQAVIPPLLATGIDMLPQALSEGGGAEVPLAERGATSPADLAAMSKHGIAPPAPSELANALAKSGEKAGGMGAMMTEPASAVTPAKAAMRGSRKVVSTFPWDDLNLLRAQEAAQSDQYLQRGTGGQYVGAPRGVNTPRKLAKMREGVDADVAKGAFGADWYERARAAIQEMAGSDPAKADRLSKMLALYSPVTPPDANMGMALKQINDYILKGDQSTAKPYMPYQAVKGRDIMRGEDPYLGEKVGVYQDHINPNKAEASKVRGVNDIWMGRSYDYPGVDGRPFERGFSDSEHSFLTGENLRAAMRAKEAGILPEGVDPNVGTVQAAGWVGNRYQQLLDENSGKIQKLIDKGKYEDLADFDKELQRRASSSYDGRTLDKYTGNETFELVPGRKTDHLDRAPDLPLGKRQELSKALDWAPPGQPDPLYKALGMPQRPTTEGLGSFTSEVDRPTLEPAVQDPRTGKVLTGPSHAVTRMNFAMDPDFQGDVGDYGKLLDGYLKNPERKFINRSEAGDVFRSAGGTPSTFATQLSDPRFQGQLASEDLMDFNPKVKVNVTDENPNRTAHPMVGYAKGAQGYDPATQSILKQVNAFRSVMDAQDAGAFSGVATGTGNAGNAARVTFKKPPSVKNTQRLYKDAAAAGLDLIDHGGGRFEFTKFKGPDEPPMTKQEFSAAFKSFEPKLQGVADILRGGHVGDYQPVPWGERGSGVTTDWLMNNVEPRIGDALTNPGSPSTAEVREALLRKNLGETTFKEENPFDVSAPRNDLQSLRGLIAQHGLEGVRAMVEQAGGGIKGAAKLGLPAAAVGFLYQQGADDGQAATQ